MASGRGAMVLGLSWAMYGSRMGRQPTHRAMIRRAFVRMFSGAICASVLGVEVDEPGTFADLLLAIYRGEYTDREPDCPRPPLIAPNEFISTEIDYPSGTCVFGLVCTPRAVEGQLEGGCSTTT